MKAKRLLKRDGRRATVGGWMGQTGFHLSDKVLECIENLLCLSKALLRQKPVLKPNQGRDDGSVHL